VEVRRAGLSRVGDDTLLTVVLDVMAEPRVTTRTVSGKPQLVMEFPQGRAGRLPTRIIGDELLVEEVRTETPPGGGVRLVVDLFPDRPYVYWRKIQKGPGGQVLFILGLRPEAGAQARPRDWQPGSAKPYLPPPEPPPTKEPEPAPEEFTPQPKGPVVPGSFGELQRLIPRAGPLLQGLEREGWIIAESRNYDQPGQRFSRDFLLTHRQYPELAVKIVHLPANVPNTPNINFIILATDRVGGEAATKYRELRQWNFSKIKQKFEDIGDFFDDALKPLRVKLREQTKAVALQDAKVFEGFLIKACPRNPQVAEKVMTHIREKVSPRFEGVQYTVSEDPLVLLNLVDFLYVKVFFLDKGQ
jgi:hypothetical protein